MRPCWCTLQRDDGDQDFFVRMGKRVIELNTRGKEVNLAIPSDMPEDVRMEMGIGLHILESRQSQTDLN